MERAKRGYTYATLQRNDNGWDFEQPGADPVLLTESLPFILTSMSAAGWDFVTAGGDEQFDFAVVRRSE